MPGQGTIVATGAIGYPVGLGAVGQMIGAEKVMSMTSTYDHRVIQGAESGRFLKVVEEYLQGEHGFYDELFAQLGTALGPLPAPPAPVAAAAAARDAAAPAPHPPRRSPHPPRPVTTAPRRRPPTRSCCAPSRPRSRC